MFHPIPRVLKISPGLHPSSPSFSATTRHQGVEHLDLSEGLRQNEERRVGRDARRGEAGEGLALADDAWRGVWEGVDGPWGPHK